MDGKSLIIALPTNSFIPVMGGAEIGLHNIALRLQQKGHIPIVIASAPLVAQLRREGWDFPYKVISFPPKIWGVFRHWPALGFMLFDAFYSHLQRRYGFDVWHGTMGFPIGVTLTHFAAQRNIPHLVRCAGADIQVEKEIGYGMRLDPAIDRLVREWLPRSNRLVAITESVADEYHKIGVGDGKIARIPNGVDLARFKNSTDRIAMRRRLGLRENSFVFLAVGRNHPKKNLAALVRSANILRQRTERDFTILIVGNEAEQLIPLAAELDVERYIKIRGQVGLSASHDGSIQIPTDDLVEIYKSADAFSFPSLLETFGIVLVEAMAAGLPIITTDAPGCRDVIRSGKDGLLVSADNDEELVNAMELIMDDDKLRQDYSEKSKARASDFSWDTVVDSYVDLYKQIIREKSNPRSETGTI